MTAVEWLVKELESLTALQFYQETIVEKAKEMEKKQSHEYAEFALKCDRINMKILNFEDYLKI
ncbi:hypothetical protein UFOVP523_43 [uncultured Caudovirales phage]|uniref:Uncharacterized protein n=1 Tax=uncultured Caudovirales phage TaxID=2100421 RepID=A0A6J5MQN9_9CAUD|nr:hypothetical protein UFOVP523_43 [uncultured Caudovirales phage]